MSFNTNRDRYHPVVPEPRMAGVNGSPPELPPRGKPPIRSRNPAFRDPEADQARQIQSSGEDISFTKKDIIIAVMGVTGAGKSTFISLLCDAEIEIGHGLQSCTTKVGVYYFLYQGVRVFLVDTPGFDDTNRSDSEVLKDVAFWMAAAYIKETHLAGIIYLHRISDPRMGGSALRNLRMFRQLCGTNNLRSVILATTHWKNADGVSIPESVGQGRIKELVETDEFWGGMVERGSRVVRHDGSKNSAFGIISDLVNRRLHVTLDISKQLIDQKRSLFDTDAGKALQTELIAERKKFERKLGELKTDMEFAMKEKDVKWQRQIEEDKIKYEAHVKKTHSETEALRTNMKKITEEKDAQFRAIQEEMKRERQAYELKLNQSLNEIKVAREEQRRHAEEARREKKASDEREARKAREYQEQMAEMAERMREEHNEAIRERMEMEREAAEERFQQQRADAQAAVEEQRRRWEQQQDADRRREEELERQAEKQRQRMEELDLQTRKRSWYNPMRWMGEKYRDP